MLEREEHVRADHLYVLRVERQAEREPLVDEPGSKGPAEEVEGEDTTSSCLDKRRLLPDDVGCRVEEAVLVFSGTGVEGMTKACCRGRPDREESPVEEARVDRDERAVREQVFEDLKVGSNWFRSSSGRLVLMSSSNTTKSRRETLSVFSGNVWLHGA